MALSSRRLPYHELDRVHAICTTRVECWRRRGWWGIRDSITKSSDPGDDNYDCDDDNHEPVTHCDLPRTTRQVRQRPGLVYTHTKSMRNGGTTIILQRPHR